MDERIEDALSETAKELKDKDDCAVGGNAYFANLNAENELTIILKNKDDYNYFDALQGLSARITILYTEIYEDLKKYSRVLRYISQEKRFSLCKVIGSLYGIVKLTATDEGKKSDCIKLLELTDSSTGLLSKANASEIDTAVNNVLNGSFMNPNDRYDLLRKTVEWGAGYATAGSREKLQYIVSIAGTYGKEFLTDVLNRIDYQQGKLKAIGKNGKEICTAAYTEYLEKTLFGKLLFASYTKTYKAYFLTNIENIAKMIESDIYGKNVMSNYIIDANVGQLKNALEQISKCSIAINPWVLLEIDKLKLLDNGSTLTLATFQQRFNIKDVTDDLYEVMRSNTLFFMAHRHDLLFFYEHVKSYAKFDLKNSNEKFMNLQYCIFDGKLYRGDAPGNISFGYFGTAAGFSRAVLLGGAGAAQMMSDRNLSGLTRLYPDFGDNPGDQDFIKMGIDLYYEDWHNNKEVNEAEE